ncbi:MAG: hypothetical protein CMJ84_18070 [Planctomycetes bacterium]|nr:hypothetical protein [Planctomycetota bacterium]
MVEAGETLFSTGVPVNRSLFLLALRRGLRPGLIVAALTLAGALLLTGGAGSGLEVGGEDGARIERGLARQAMWTALCLLVAPAIAIAAAREVGRWRAGEAAWLAARAAPPRVIVGSTWLGLTAGAGLAALALILSAEAAAGGAAAGVPLRAAGVLRTEMLEAPVTPGTLSWSCPAPAQLAPASRARLALAVWARGGPAAQIALAVERAGGGGRTTLERRLARAAIVDIELPRGAGDFLFTLEHRGEGAAVVLEQGALTLLVPVASERLASVELALRLLLALASWTAVGLGFGAWMSAPGAALVLAGAQALVWLAAGPAGPWFPASDLGAALAWTGAGIVPPTLTPAAWLGTAGWVAAGLVIARLGLVRGWGAA